MCGFSGNVDTFLDPLRYSVGALNAGRIERADRAKVLVSILCKDVSGFFGKWILMRGFAGVSKLQLQWSSKLTER
jgi:hypothetical protein